MVMFVLLMEILLKKVVWSSVITTPGGLCVMTPGVVQMLALCAGSWDSQPQERQLSLMLHLVRALVLSCWMMSTVSELRTDWLTVLPMLLVTITVYMVKMLESGACQVCYKLHSGGVSLKLLRQKYGHNYVLLGQYVPISG